MSLKKSFNSTSKNYSRGSILIDENIWPTTLTKIRVGSVRWLSRHPGNGLLSPVQSQIAPNSPVGSWDLVTGIPVEHCLVTSDVFDAEECHLDVWIKQFLSAPTDHWPELQPFELISVFGDSLNKLPKFTFELVKLGSRFIELFELIAPLQLDNLSDLTQFVKDSGDAAIFCGSGQKSGLYGLCLQNANDQELERLYLQNNDFPLRLYRLKIPDTSAIHEFDSWLMNQIDIITGISEDFSYQFRDLRSLSTLSIESVDIDAVRADDINPTAVALLLMACQAVEVTPRLQRLQRTSSVLFKQATIPSLRTLISILAPLTELRLIELSQTYRNLLVSRTPFFAAPINNSAEDQDHLCLWQPREGLRFAVYDPLQSDSQPSFISLGDLPHNPQSIFTIEQDPTAGIERFGFRWFMPELKRHKLALSIILVSSLFIQVLQLANPLLIQQIIDLVLGQRSISTLYSYGSFLIVLAFFQSLLTGLRSLLFVETTNRIDVRVGTSIIDHLLHLPISYFDKRPVGEVSTRVGELENIRSFLTGQALTVFLDVLFSIIYIVVMLIYSVPLTIAALSTIPFSVILAVVFSPVIKNNIDDRAVSAAKTTSFLVEHLNGMMTVKSQNIEDLTRISWRRLYVDFVQKGFRLTGIGTIVGELNNFLTLLSSVLVIFVGAILVIDGKLSVGQLIAFRIISGYVTAPIMRLSTLWRSFQELSVSVQRLADVVESKTEPQTQTSRFILPPIKGNVKLCNLSFRYPGTEEVVLKRLNLTVPAGSFVGVVGGSGSGKSTLMKLFPLIYRPTGGTILIDDYDTQKVDLDSLRQQIGIVPQEPLLFAGSVWDNLIVGNAKATEKEVEKAVRASEAYEFIMQLPNGFETDVGERGGRLSGGQRQRLAIARALLSNPSLLVLDEATSALDYRTEAAVCRNLFKYLEGKTVFFVTHRLATIRPADVILMMDRGVVVESGTYDELLSAEGLFSSFVGCQNRDGSLNS
ncbi:multidrug efflux family ABC transporter [Prochlorococcus marinus str. MIT 9313]|uniref:Multidrug efflux family ABC transporter n=1 Tax=Prochlorococcus marinus (strain MIT 9313) TaxID=74547 RepID=Q7V965_PROMM|nr:peptidase domain-containing ABC transporter [Prochlorococcus marinus]CAE20268.1 multidrug efflux family ABC transporter [Prochlorococcus marinus str. MIT 9313]